jgi:DNA modification methylase
MGGERVTVRIAEHDMTLHQGHVLDVLPTLEPESVNCVVTSPPYYGLRDYGVEPSDWPAVDYSPMPGLPPVAVPAMTCCLGLEPDPWAFIGHLALIFREVRRVLRPDGVLWLNLGDSYAGKANGGETYDRHRGHGHRSKEGIVPPRINNIGAAPYKSLLGIPSRVALALQADDWAQRNAIIWHKPNAMPESVTDRMSCRYEQLFLFAKSPRYWFALDAIREDRAPSTLDRYRYAFQEHGNSASLTNHLRNGGMVEKANPAGRNPGDVWSIPTAPYAAAHFATFPPELARRCIAAGCPPDGTVLDPFAGSGTALMVARRLLRKSVGIELSAAYCSDHIVDRIGQTPFDFGEVPA